MFAPTLHLRGESIVHPIAWKMSDEGRDFSKRCRAAWGLANEAAGASPEAAATRVANTNAFYAPEPDLPS